MMTTHVNNRRNGVNLIICIVVFYILFRYTFDRNHYDQEQQLPIIIIPGGGLTPEGNLPDYGMDYGCGTTTHIENMCDFVA